MCETIGNSVLPILPNVVEFTKLSTTKNTDSNMPAVSSSDLNVYLENENSMDFTSSSSVNKSDKDSVREEERPNENTRKKIDLTYEDWLDAIGKTIENSIKKENQDDKDVFIISPCPLSAITKLMADRVAMNFRTLFEFDSLISGGGSGFLGTSPKSSKTSITDSAAASSDASKGLHNETVNIIENFTRGSYTFGYSTFPNDEDSRMPISVWTNCSYTIQVIGKKEFFKVFF